MRYLPVILCLFAAACTDLPTSQPTEPVPVSTADPGPRLSSRAAVNNFRSVVRRVEPVAERICQQRAPNLNCDFRIIIDERPNQAPNAYQTRDANGRPIIAFNVPLLAEARNQDEVAFIMSHEAAHHIQGHLDRQQRNATLGAVVFGQVAGALSGVGEDVVRQAQQVGAAVGARTYSKDFELEADALGTRIADAAGYNPLRGADFFFRIPDPGNKFLGTHPANADRLRTVQRVAGGL